MGRGKFRRGRGGGGGQTRRFQPYADIVKENANLERYYNGLLGLDDDAERDEFWSTYRRELPNSFRFCGSKGHALAVKKLLQSRYIPDIVKITDIDGQPVTPPEPVPWYPDSLAWWMTTNKNVVRKYPPFAAFQKYLVSESTVGNISRQEVVSMIPPLLLDVRPGMAVLDLCAAPGSKAAQLIEMLHRGEEGRIRRVLRSVAAEDGQAAGALPAAEDDGDDGYDDLATDPGDAGRATGILIANDSDYKRSQLLIHQLKRLSSANTIVTNHDATMYPPIRLPSDDPKTPRLLKFDRILADVPCSGDGTLRKNISIWKDWLPGNALGLHATQVRILVRALQMLKPGGRVVYSTCSMNPVENESVIVSAIERCGPSAVEIVDSSHELPALKRKPGLGVWQVMDKSGRTWNNWKEVEEYTKSTADGIGPGRIAESMFPRPDDNECSRLPLERCVRVYPHLQDTGGFFIVALEKKAEFKAKPETWKRTSDLRDPAKGPTLGKEVSKANGAAPNENTSQINSIKEEEAEREEAAPETEVATVHPDANGAAHSTKRELEEEDGTPHDTQRKKQKVEEDEDVAKVKVEDASRRRRKPEGPYEEPFKYLPADHPVIGSVREFYNLSDRFPADRYMVRNALGEPAKAIYYTNALIRDILTANEGKGVKFVHGGVKMFVKQESPSAEVCRWRIQSEGLPILQGYVGPGRIVSLRKRETLRKLLIEMFPKVGDGGWQDLDEIGERVRDAGMGCLVLRVDPEDGDDDLEPMALPLWKSFHSVNLMLPKEDRSAMLLRIFNDTTPLINTVPQKNKPQQPEPAGTEEEAVRDKEEDATNGVVKGEDGPVDEDQDLYAVEDAPSV